MRLVVLILVGSGLSLSAAPASLPVLFESGSPGWETVRGVAATDARVLRNGKPTLRLESAVGKASDAVVLSAPVEMEVGKTYEVSAWVRTEGLVVEDVDRSPIAVGAAIRMSSMPHDVRSVSVGGSRDWTRVSLKFTATRAKDRIALSAGYGGAIAGKAWFAAIALDRAGATSAAGMPLGKNVRTFGPAYRYGIGGWTYLHIEGEPYDRGYQHGYLLAREIEGYMARGAATLGGPANWDSNKTMADALFARGFDDEIRLEMKGIADGAAAAGSKWNDHAVDFLDIVTVNVVTEIELLRGALQVTPSGLEGLGLRPPAYARPGGKEVPVTDRCSAFAATGKATRDGKMVIGHVTWWPQTLSEQTNILLDVKPVKGNRVLMQAYPGGIQSGTDWYQNERGIVLTETTIAQSPFNAQGTPVAFRARKAIQYGDSIDHVVNHLKERNNGLYTNEWIIGDGLTNEIAMLELGTQKTKLYRSSRNEWFGGTEGFYWGCNNAKDLAVRMELMSDPQGTPAHVPFTPAPRDVAWQAMYQQHKGSIDEEFGFLAFRTAPLVAKSTMDAKVVTADMATRMMVWANFGRPNERERLPSARDLLEYSGNLGQFTGGYRLVQASLPEAVREGIAAAERDRMSKPAERLQTEADETSEGPYKDKLWKGWILPAGDGDLWLTMGAARYHEGLDGTDLAEYVEGWLVKARRAELLGGAVALREIRADVGARHWRALAEAKGALTLDALRRELGDEKFLGLMREFFAAHTTKTVTSSAFEQAASKAAGKPLDAFFGKWLGETGVGASGPAFLTADVREALADAVIVYGTVLEAGANRFAAERLQSRFNDWYEKRIPVRKDFEVIEADLAERNVIFVGRPETNSALAAWEAALRLSFDGASFVVSGKTYASEHDGLMQATTHPRDAKRMVLIVAGNSPVETARIAGMDPTGRVTEIFQAGKAVTGAKNHQPTGAP